MSDLKRQKLLHGLLVVKDLRKSVAEADYLRCARQEQQRHAAAVQQAKRLDAHRAALPARQASILRGLRIKPVGLQEIHYAHEMVSKLHDTLATLEQERGALMADYHLACDATGKARAKLTGAIHQVEKFRTVKTHNDARRIHNLNLGEEGELEDRLRIDTTIFDDTPHIA